MVRVLLLPLPLLAACSDKGDDSGAAADPLVTSFQLHWWADPEPATANQESEIFFQILDQDGAPVENLQQNHERMAHMVFISGDLSSFEHKHHEDYAAITADDLRSSTFHVPEAFPYSGTFLLAIDFAYANTYQQLSDTLDVEGDVPQLEAPVEDLSTTVSVDGVTADFSWEISPYAGLESVLWVHLTDEDGADITDLVQWLGADAHLVMVKEDLTGLAHTHAYVDGMDSLPPDHSMPQEWTGPDLPFHVTLPYPGVYKSWLQFTREGAPDTPVTVPFMFEVSP